MAELFVYNFLGQEQQRQTLTFADFAANLATLMFSADALNGAWKTVLHNVVSGAPAYEIKPRGYFYYPPGHDAQGTFASFPGGMFDLYKKVAGRYKLDAVALQSFRQMNAAARNDGLELIWIATPNHACFDYFLELVGEWDVVEAWLKQVSAEATVLSFSQPNDWVHEPVASGMTYWNDPFHFSLKMGEGIQMSLVGRPLSGRPENFMVRLTPDKVAGHIAQRRQAIRAWAAKNPDFAGAMVLEFEKFKQAAKN